MFCNVFFINAEVIHGKDCSAAPKAGFRIEFCKIEGVVRSILHWRDIDGRKIARAVGADCRFAATGRRFALCLCFVARRLFFKEGKDAAVLRVRDACKRGLPDQIGRAVHIEQQEGFLAGGLQGKVLFLAGELIAKPGGQKLQVGEIGVVIARAAGAALIQAVAARGILIEIVKRAQQDRFAALLPLHGVVLAECKGAQIKALDAQPVRGFCGSRVGDGVARRICVAGFFRRVDNIVNAVDACGLKIGHRLTVRQRRIAARRPVDGDAERRGDAAQIRQCRLGRKAIFADLFACGIVGVGAVSDFGKIGAIKCGLPLERLTRSVTRLRIDHGAAGRDGRVHVFADIAADSDGRSEAVHAGCEMRGFDHGIVYGPIKGIKSRFAVSRRNIRVADPGRGQHAGLCACMECKVARGVCRLVRKHVNRDIGGVGIRIHRIHKTGLHAGHHKLRHHQHGVVVRMLRIAAADGVEDVVLVVQRDDLVVVAGGQTVCELRRIAAAAVAGQFKRHGRVVRVIGQHREGTRLFLLTVDCLRSGGIFGKMQNRVEGAAAVRDGERAEIIAVKAAERTVGMRPFAGLAVVFDRVADQILAAGVKQEHELISERDGRFEAVDLESVIEIVRSDRHGCRDVELCIKLESRKLHADAHACVDIDLGRDLDAAPILDLSL